MLREQKRERRENVPNYQKLKNNKITIKNHKFMPHLGESNKLCAKDKTLVLVH